MKNDENNHGDCVPDVDLNSLVGNPCDDCKNKIVSYEGFDGYPALYPDYYCDKNYRTIEAKKTGACAGQISNANGDSCGK